MLYDNYRKKLNEISICSYKFTFTRDAGDITVPGYDRAGFLPCAEDGTFDCIHAHLHPLLEIIAVTEGVLHATIGNRKYCLQAGDILIVNVYEYHQGIMKPETGRLTYYCLLFDPVFYSASLPKYYMEQMRCICLCSKRFIEYLSAADYRSKSFHTLLAHLHPLFAEGTERAQMSMLPDMYALIDLMLSDCLLDQAEINSSVQFIVSVAHYIHKNFMKELTTEKIAHDLSYSTSYFCRRFHTCIGMTFREYLCRYRVHEAAAFLVKREKPLTEIAAEVGFGDYSHFARSFKKYMGVTPAVYFKSNKT